MTEIKAKEAVIYCRAASRTQAGPDKLDAQEARCREYASSKGYAVARVFADDGSGNTIDRPGLQALLAFLRQDQQQGYVVIMEDLTRLARDVQKLAQLRAEIENAGGSLQWAAAVMRLDGRLQPSHPAATPAAAG